MPPFEHLRMQNYLVNDINSLLDNYGIDTTIDLSDITLTENTVTDLVKINQKLSNSIIDSLWPSINSKIVYHYTSKDNAESILNSDEFRLYSLNKRFHEGEIASFCENHKLGGYLEHDENGVPKYKSLIMDNMYYASFTDTNITPEQEEYFWRTFAPVDGVRIEFKVTALNPNFRKMVYETTMGKPLSLLCNLSELVRNLYSREFILSGISSVCAFYLAKEFDVENEYRALYKSQEFSGPQPDTDGTHQYINVPLGKISDTGYKIEIHEVQSNENLNIPSQYATVVKRRHNKAYY